MSRQREGLSQHSKPASVPYTLSTHPEMTTEVCRAASADKCGAFETIHRSLFIQARGVLERELMDHLCSRQRSQHTSEHGESHGLIVDALSPISQTQLDQSRCAYINVRERP